MDDRTSVRVAPKEVGPAASRRWRITLSPINQRRWQNFKANRRGYISLWVFLVLFAISLCAELIASDKPRSAASSRLRPTTAIPICRNSSLTRAASWCGR